MPPNFYFDRATQRYRDQETGRFISQSRMRSLLGGHINQVREDLTTIGELLINGRISLPTWEQETRTALKALHTSSYLLGIGGEANMSQRDYGILGQQIRSQYEFLRGFAEELINTGMSEAAFRSRLEMYAWAARGSHEMGKLEGHVRAGFTWERRIRTKSNSCSPCISYAAAGWQPIGSLPHPTRDCECRANCGCYKRFSRGEQRPEDFLNQRFGWINLDQLRISNGNFRS